MTIKHLFPPAWPTLDLNFAATRELDPRITFTRSSIGTYVDANGIVQTAADDEPRFDHDPATRKSLGLLLEESRTNLVADSASANNWTVLAGGTFAASSSICPDGSTDGTRVTAVTLNDGAYKLFTATTSGNHIGTYYARTRTGVAVDVKVALSGGAGPTVTLPADGTWVRVLGGSSNLGAGSKYLSVRSASASMDIDVWGLQAELGAFPTSYIPTSGSTATRSADVASITGTNFSSWYNQSEGTYVAKFRSQYPDGEGTTVMKNGSRIFALADFNRVQFDYGSTSVYSNNNQSGYPAASEFSIAAMFYTDDGTNSTTGGSFQGFPAVSASGTGSVTNTELKFAPFTGASGSLQSSTAHLSRIAYYPRRLTDAQLEALTA